MTGHTRKDTDRAEVVGFWIGVGAFALVCLAIYVVYRILLPKIGDGWATLIVFAPAFCAVLMIAPVQWRVSYFLRCRYCRKHGHAPRQLLGGAPESMVCERCSALLPHQAVTSANRKD